MCAGRGVERARGEGTRGEGTREEGTRGGRRARGARGRGLWAGGRVVGRVDPVVRERRGHRVGGAAALVGRVQRIGGFVGEQARQPCSRERAAGRGVLPEEPLGDGNARARLLAAVVRCGRRAAARRQVPRQRGVAAGRAAGEGSEGRRGHVGGEARDHRVDEPRDRRAGECGGRCQPIRLPLRAAGGGARRAQRRARYLSEERARRRALARRRVGGEGAGVMRGGEVVEVVVGVGRIGAAVLTRHPQLDKLRLRHCMRDGRDAVDDGGLGDVDGEGRLLEPAHEAREVAEVHLRAPRARA